MIELKDIEREVLIEGLEDYVGAWEFAWLIRNRDAEAALEAVRQEAIDSIRRLLEEGLIIAGRLLDNGGFEPWSGAVGEVMEQILLEWSALSRDPQIGEICWFSTTTDGDELAERLRAEGTQ